MAKRVWFQSAEASTGGFEVRHYRSEDGYPAAQTADVVYITLSDGRQLYLPNLESVPAGEVDGEPYPEGARLRYDVKEMLERVQRRGSVDLACWLEVDRNGESLEGRLEHYAHEERMERRGLHS